MGDKSRVEYPERLVHSRWPATEHCGKKWTYLLIPHDQIDETKTLAGLAASCTFNELAT